MEKINDYDNSNNNKLRKSSSMDNRINNRKKYNNFRYSFNNKNENIKEKEETKEEDDINYISFPLFCNSYDPYYLSEKINNSFSHNSKLIYRDPNDYTKQELKSRTFYFDKNNNQILRQKDWINENKK